MTKQEFIAEARKVHGDKYDYSLVEFVRKTDKVKIICPKHDVFRQSVKLHLKGCGCKNCAIEKQSDSRRSTKDEFISKAKEIHGDKYDYSKVEYVNSITPVTLICRVCGNEFKQRPSNHINMRNGCPFCSGTLKKTTEQFIEEARKIHGNKYDYSKVEYTGNKNDVCIICHEKDENGVEHGEFIQQALTHLQGHGCSKCSNRYKRNTEEFIQKANTIHHNLYDYSKVNYNGSHNKVTIICHKKDKNGVEHGEFEQVAKNHLNGEKCPKCKIEKLACINNSTTDEFIRKSIEIHGVKYDYSKTVYINNKMPVIITCKKHGDFPQLPHDHLQGHGCPKCGNISSEGETEIVKYISSFVGENNVQVRNRVLIKPYEIDIYVPSMKLGIEYNGLVWHSERFGKDKSYHIEKIIKCNELGIKLIHIFEDEFIEKRDIVLNKIKYILGYGNNNEKIYARKCNAMFINSKEAKIFLEKNHIQGFSPSSVYIGAFYNNLLIGVMSFKKEIKSGDNWELTRFATDINYHCVGVGGKLFKYFTRNYNPDKVKSFADRRWTVDKDNNLYTKIGFNLSEILKPDYRYVVGNRRIHKFNCRKQRLLKEFKNDGLDESMTEKQMCDKLGFYRIWDCGLLKYEWINKN